MSLPPLVPDKTVAGIAVDPRTLERVIPESRRPDGSVRKQLKVRPGFTPQEDVRRFRGTRQAQMDANALPKGHIVGWAPPPSSSTRPGASAAAKGAKPGAEVKDAGKAVNKNQKRREKKREKKAEGGEVPDNWDDDEGTKSGSGTGGKSSSTPASPPHNNETPNWASAPDPPSSPPSAASTAKDGKEGKGKSKVDALADAVSKLDVQ
ncbi:hypothetical protein PLICRDRAFT_25528 [Plicaturopsis crispa FD-325 SS-3]|nr:hypothetical protein PLICRDRAFT_25528 [Plicaturopsis crispa FD-325 SS-3]